jgi:hypothetical protein
VLVGTAMPASGGEQAGQARPGGRWGGQPVGAPRVIGQVACPGLQRPAGEAAGGSS